MATLCPPLMDGSTQEIEKYKSFTIYIVDIYLQLYPDKKVDKKQYMRLSSSELYYKRGSVWRRSKDFYNWGVALDAGSNHRKKQHFM